MYNVLHSLIYVKLKLYVMLKFLKLIYFSDVTRQSEAVILKLQKLINFSDVTRESEAVILKLQKKKA